MLIVPSAAPYSGALASYDWLCKLYWLRYAPVRYGTHIEPRAGPIRAQLGRAGGCGRETRPRLPMLPGFDTQLEACVFHLICRNAEELTSLKVGQPWRCDLSESRLDGLRLALVNTTRELRLLSV